MLPLFVCDNIQMDPCLHFYLTCCFPHQNGSLLRKYAYLSNDSSYSISIEDGVDISLLDNSSSDDDKKILDYMNEQSDVLNSSYSENDSNRPQSFTFESHVGFFFVDAVLLACVL